MKWTDDRWTVSAQMRRLLVNTSGHIQGLNHCSPSSSSSALTLPLRARITKNPEVNAGPLARPFACLLVPLTCSLILPCLLCSHAPLCSLVCSLAHFTYSLARGTVNDWVNIYCVFFDSGPQCLLPRFSNFTSTVEPRYSAFQGTGQNYTLYRGFHYCQYIDNYKNTFWD